MNRPLPLRALAAPLVLTATLAAAQPAPAPMPAPARAKAGVERRFDMDAARATVRTMVRNGELGRLPDERTPDNTYAAQSVLRNDRDVQLGRAIEGARRGYCQNQYAGAGLLAVIPILYDMVRDSGCRW